MTSEEKEERDILVDIIRKNIDAKEIYLRRKNSQSFIEIDVFNKGVKLYA